MQGMDTDKNRKIKNLSKNTALFTIGSFGARIISFLLVPLYTFVLSTDEYGMLDIVNTTVQLLIPVMTLNVQDAVLRFGLDKRYQKEDVVHIGLRINAVSFVVLGILLLLSVSFHIVNIPIEYIVFLYASYFFGAINNCLMMYLKTKDKVGTITFWGVINTILTCTLNLLFLLALKLGIDGYMLAYVFGTAVADVGMFFSAKVYLDIKASHYDKVLRKAMLLYSIPLVLNSIAWWINNASDRYILTYFRGTALNGVYAVSYKIPSILSIVQTIFYNAWSVSAITEYDKDDTDGFIGDVYSTYSSMSFVACSFIMVFNIVIAKILYAKEFFQAWEYVPALLTGTVFNGLGLFIGCIFAANKKTKDLSITTLIGALLNTVLNIVLIPKFGALGAAVATLLGYCTVWMIRIIRVRNIIVMKCNWKKQIICIIVLFVQCLIASFLKNPLFQLPCLAVVFFLSWDALYKAGNKMMTIVKRRKKL